MSENIKYKYLKLDKFVSGLEQRIFKTTTLDTTLSDTNLTILSSMQKDVFYGDFNSQKIVEAKTFNKQNISGNLINFHDINADYINNRPDKNNILTLNTSTSPWFNIASYNNQFNVEKNKDERVTFFPTFIDTPIDIAYSRNQSYLLLPISTNKYTNLVQSNITLKYKNQGPEALYKPNYEKMYEYQWSKPYYYSEDNSIPIYDLNFSFVEIIDLKTHENVLQFLSDNNLLNIKLASSNSDYTLLSSQIIFDSNINQLNPDTRYMHLFKTIFRNNGSTFIFV